MARIGRKKIAGVLFRHTCIRFIDQRNSNESNDTNTRILLDYAKRNWSDVTALQTTQSENEANQDSTL